MANHSRPIELAASDRAELERLQRSSASPAGLSRRGFTAMVRDGTLSQPLHGVFVVGPLPDDLAARSTGPGSGFRPGEAVGPAAIGQRPAA